MSDQTDLQVDGLRTEFRVGGAWHAAVDNVSFSLDRRETLALVGEFGCGKSVTALSVMGLVPHPAGRIAAGGSRWRGRTWLVCPNRRWKSCVAHAWA